MSAKKLALKLDLIKVGLFNALFCCSLSVAFAAFLGIFFKGFPTLVYVVIGMASAIGLFVFWGRPRAASWLELTREGLSVATDGGRALHPWQTLSRFTLIQFETDEQNEVSQDSFYVAARSASSAAIEDPDAATTEDTADLMFRIDDYVSYHRYSGRSAEQEAACKSPQDFADTLNRWRDFALNLEIGAIPTPLVTSKDDRPSDLELKIYSKLTS